MISSVHASMALQKLYVFLGDAPSGRWPLAATQMAAWEMAAMAPPPRLHAPAKSVHDPPPRGQDFLLAFQVFAPHSELGFCRTSVHPMVAPV